ncbi:MAG: hypothetical protein ACE365_02105 [Gammaproteobacteria bacterium]
MSGVRSEEYKGFDEESLEYKGFDEESSSSGSVDPKTKEMAQAIGHVYHDYFVEESINLEHPELVQYFLDNRDNIEDWYKHNHKNYYPRWRGLFVEKLVSHYVAADSKSLSRIFDNTKLDKVLLPYSLKKIVDNLSATIVDEQSVEKGVLRAVYNYLEQTEERFHSINFKHEVLIEEIICKIKERVENFDDYLEKIGRDEEGLKHVIYFCMNESLQEKGDTQIIRGSFAGILVKIHNACSSLNHPAHARITHAKSWIQDILVRDNEDQYSNIGLGAQEGDNPLAQNYPIENLLVECVLSSAYFIDPVIFDQVFPYFSIDTLDAMIQKLQHDVDSPFKSHKVKDRKLFLIKKAESYLHEKQLNVNDDEFLNHLENYSDVTKLLVRAVGKADDVDKPCVRLNVLHFIAKYVPEALYAHHNIDVRRRLKGISAIKEVGLLALLGKNAAQVVQYFQSREQYSAIAALAAPSISQPVDEASFSSTSSISHSTSSKSTSSQSSRNPLLRVFPSPRRKPFSFTASSSGVSSIGSGSDLSSDNSQTDIDLNDACLILSYQCDNLPDLRMYGSLPSMKAIAAILRDESVSAENRLLLVSEISKTRMRQLTFYLPEKYKMIFETLRSIDASGCGANKASNESTQTSKLKRLVKALKGEKESSKLKKLALKKRIQLSERYSPLKSQLSSPLDEIEFSSIYLKQYLPRLKYVYRYKKNSEEMSLEKFEKGFDKPASELAPSWPEKCYDGVRWIQNIYNTINEDDQAFRASAAKVLSKFMIKHSGFSEKRHVFYSALVDVVIDRLQSGTDVDLRAGFSPVVHPDVYFQTLLRLIKEEVKGGRNGFKRFRELFQLYESLANDVDQDQDSNQELADMHSRFSQFIETREDSWINRPSNTEKMLQMILTSSKLTTNQRFECMQQVANSRRSDNPHFEVSCNLSKTIQNHLDPAALKPEEGVTDRAKENYRKLLDSNWITHFGPTTASSRHTSQRASHNQP